MDDAAVCFGPALFLIGFHLDFSARDAGRRNDGRRIDGYRKKQGPPLRSEKDTKVTFDDVAGIDEAENELVEIVDFLRDTDKYTRLGGTSERRPLGWRARHWEDIAGEGGGRRGGGAVFLDERRRICGDDCGCWRGESGTSSRSAGARSCNHLHRRAGFHRPRPGANGDRGRERTGADLNQILTEMDGFSSREGIIVLAATNQPEVLDKALLRPARFDRRVVVNLPDKVAERRSSKSTPATSR